MRRASGWRAGKMAVSGPLRGGWRCVYQSHCADLLPRDPASVGMRRLHGCRCSMGYPVTVLACDNRMAANPLKSLGADLT